MIPLIVQNDISEGQKDSLRQRFGHSPEWDRSVRENVWRRHQDESNKEASGWVPGACRRRLLHFRDRYALVGNDFCLVETYLFLTVKAPKDEIERYKARIRPVPGLKLEVNEYPVHPADIEARRVTPHDYASLDVRVFSHSYNQQTADKPWKILKTGIREQHVKGTPTIIADLEPFYPAQVELGCGPSIEAGIPPLNYFHKLFSIHKKGKFVLRAEEDEFLDFFDNPLEWYTRAVYMHKQTLLASPTPFYHDLKRLHEEGKIVGPIITNNFDGLALGVGLTELPLRQYDEEGVYPPIAFHPAAKSLFVIGAHADRRKCQQHARRAGLKIVHIDPEGYWNDGVFIPYPLEAPQSEDYILNASANDAFKPASQPRR